MCESCRRLRRHKVGRRLLSFFRNPAGRGSDLWWRKADRTERSTRRLRLPEVVKGDWDFVIRGQAGWWFPFDRLWWYCGCGIAGRVNWDYGWGAALGIRFDFDLCTRLMHWWFRMYLEYFTCSDEFNEIKVNSEK